MNCDKDLTGLNDHNIHYHRISCIKKKPKTNCQPITGFLTKSVGRSNLKAISENKGSDVTGNNESSSESGSDTDSLHEIEIESESTDGGLIEQMNAMKKKTKQVVINVKDSI